MIRIYLKRLLYDRDMNRRQLSEITGIRYDTLSMYYHEIIQRINVEDLDKICEALDCRLDELITYVPHEKKKKPQS